MVTDSGKTKKLIDINRYFKKLPHPEFSSRVIAVGWRRRQPKRLLRVTSHVAHIALPNLQLSGFRSLNFQGSGTIADDDHALLTAGNRHSTDPVFRPSVGRSAARFLRHFRLPAFAPACQRRYNTHFTTKWAGFHRPFFLGVCF